MDRDTLTRLVFANIDEHNEVMRKSRLMFYWAHDWLHEEIHDKKAVEHYRRIMAEQRFLITCAKSELKWCECQLRLIGGE